MEIVANVRWVFKEARWTDRQYNDLMADIAEEIRSKPGVLATYYMTYGYKA
jgi:hypothetical protein